MERYPEATPDVLCQLAEGVCAIRICQTKREIDAASSRALTGLDDFNRDHLVSRDQYKYFRKEIDLVSDETYIDLGYSEK